jgi:hypothetical protein
VFSPSVEFAALKKVSQATIFIALIGICWSVASELLMFLYVLYLMGLRLVVWAPFAIIMEARTIRTGLGR